MRKRHSSVLPAAIFSICAGVSRLISAALIRLLTPAQMMKIAAGNTLLCRFRMDDDMVWGLLTNHGKSAANDDTNRLHASILMAGRHQEAA